MHFNTTSEPSLRLRRSALLAALVSAVASAFSAAAATAEPISYGVVTQGYPQDVRGFEFRRMGRGDVETVRFLLLWPLIQATAGPCGPGRFNPVLGDEDPEPAENHCDWSAMDRMVGEAAARGTASLPFMFGSPDWIDSNDGEPTAVANRVPPLETEADRVAWQAFLRAALQRYGPNGVFWAPDGDYAARHPGAAPLPIGDWQVWNEPSSPAYFWPKPSPTGYARLLDLSAATMRAEDPSARIILAGLFGDPGGGPGGIFLTRYLERLYEVPGVEQDFDAVALHPFAPTVKEMRAQIELARREMRRAGDAATAVWITELGWASDGPPGILGLKSERGQARMLTRAFELLRRKRARWSLVGVNWYSLRDVPKDKAPCPGCPFTGLLARNGEAKPAWRAFTRFSR